MISSGMLALLPLIADVSFNGDGLMNLLIEVVIVAVICAVLWWFVGFCALPEPFNKVCRIIIALVAVIFLIHLLLGLSGHSVHWG